MSAKIKTKVFFELVLLVIIFTICFDVFTKAYRINTSKVQKDSNLSHIVSGFSDNSQLDKYKARYSSFMFSAGLQSQQDGLEFAKDSFDAIYRENFSRQVNVLGSVNEEEIEKLAKEEPYSNSVFMIIQYFEKTRVGHINEIFLENFNKLNSYSDDKEGLNPFSTVFLILNKKIDLNTLPPSGFEAIGKVLDELGWAGLVVKTSVNTEVGRQVYPIHSTPLETQAWNLNIIFFIFSAFLLVILVSILWVLVVPFMFLIGATSLSSSKYSSNGRVLKLFLFLSLLFVAYKGPQTISHLPFADGLSDTNKIVVSIVGVNILSLFLILFSALVIYRIKGGMMKDLGLSSFGFYNIVVEAFIGIITYFASLPFLIIILLLSVSFLSGYTQNSGAHPVASVFASIEDPILFLALALSVGVVTPIIEEFGFRGCLYSWYRSRMGFFVSAFFTSFIFAALHPQGVVGLPFLLFLAFLMTFLREWRGNLMAPIFFHMSVNSVSSILIFISVYYL